MMLLGSNIFLDEGINSYLSYPYFHFRQLGYSEKALDLGSGNKLRASFLLLIFVIWIDIISLRYNFLTCEMVLIQPTLPPFYISCED